ncbi:MAG: HEAT repeat domain-containing protein [Deltaproteobacteria bacterium]|nr:HEAT repeat domain-containing protein [Deltaproteobacteria bacterium]
MIAPVVIALSLCGAEPPPPTSVPELVEALIGCVDEQCPALRALVAKGEAVWPELDRGIGHTEELVRFWSIGVLAESPVPAARARLLQLAGDEPKARIRAAACFSLAGYPGADVTAALARALGDHDPNVRFEAASALGRRAADATAVPALAALVKALDDQDEDVRGAAAEALGLMAAVARTPEVERALLGKINDRKGPVRGRVAVAIGQLGITRAVAPLVTRAGRERDVEALAAMAWALGELGDKAALPTLEGLVGHASELVSQHAREAVAKLSAPPAAPPTK